MNLEKFFLRHTELYNFLKRLKFDPDPKLLNPQKYKLDINYYENSFEHNYVMVLLSFFGILVLLLSGIFDILNLELKLNFLLDFSAVSIFATSISILILLWYILSGKIKDARGAIDEYQK